MERKAGEKIAGMVAEGTMPFVKTPINILKRGLDYSPAGMASGMVKLTKAVGKGDDKAIIKGVDQLALGLTGTGIAALGAWLYDKGMLSTIFDSFSKEGQWQTSTGEQSYSLDIGDGYTRTLDWLVPLSIPLFLGATFKESINNIQDEKGIDMSAETVSSFMDSLGQIMNPMVEMSMLQGISNALDKVKYDSSGNPFMPIIEESLTSYGSQLVPTILGQITRTIDPVQRSTASTKQENFNKTVDRFIKAKQAKIPVLSKCLNLPQLFGVRKYQEVI